MKIEEKAYPGGKENVPQIEAYFWKTNQMFAFFVDFFLLICYTFGIM